MAERGAIPNVPKARRRALHAVRSLFSPLLPDDYLELINPLWSTQELRGRIERIDRETADAVTVLIRPGYEWIGPSARPVPADRGDRRRRPPLARLLADHRSGPPRRADRDHAEAGRRRQGLPLPGAPCPARGHRPPRRRRRHLRPPRPAAPAAPLHQRRQRHHPDHEHASQPRPRRRPWTTSSTSTPRGPPTASSSASSCASSTPAAPATAPTCRSPARRGG